SPRRVEIGLCLGEQCLRLREFGRRRGRVEPRDHLALLDALTFFDEYLHHATGRLRGDGGLASCDDVAGGVQRRRRRGDSTRGRNGCRLNGCWRSFSVGGLTA